ncbi:hypothetical protein KKC22_01325 [Myxococcota bacterium]|nr:hypothetical protein [Myxococcota bacterium]
MDVTELVKQQFHNGQVSRMPFASQGNHDAYMDAKAAEVREPTKEEFERAIEEERTRPEREAEDARQQARLDAEYKRRGL